MATPRWFLDEYAHAGDEHLDADYVLNYNHKTGTNRADDVAVLRDLGLNETHTLVDLGAGTGALALAAAPVCRRVVAVDVSPAMVDFLRQTVEQEGMSNVECVQGGFLSYEHQGDPADFLYSRNALHHLPDFWKAIALERMAAILKPGGILYLRDLTFSFELPETEQRIEAWLDAAPKQAEMGWTRPELETHLREEYSTFSWLLEPMIDRAGFDIRHAEHSGSKIYAAYTCIRR